MDEISTGLDAAVTYNIVAALRAWARTTNGTAVIALLQPTPEVFDQFDELLLLREGCPVYHGGAVQVVNPHPQLESARFLNPGTYIVRKWCVDTDVHA
jgi:ABC-type multidrug transport system ATPase subunit